MKKSVLTALAIPLIFGVACSTTPKPEVSRQQVPVDCFNLARLQPLPDDECVPGGGGGGIINPPPTASTQPKFVSFDEIINLAKQRDVSFDDALMPVYPTTKGSVQISARTQEYPLDATGSQDFVDKLFSRGLEFVRNSTPPAPDTSCSYTPVDLSNALSLSSFITLTNRPGILWPGALYEGKSIANGLGSLQPLYVPSGKRNQLQISSNTGFNRLANPEVGSVEAATREIIIDSKNTWQNSSGQSVVAFEVVEASSFQEAAIKIQNEMKAKLGSDKVINIEGSNETSTNFSKENNSVYAFFIQYLFDTKMEGLSDNGYSDRPFNALFNSDLTLDNLRDYGNRNEMGYDNLPTYVKSVKFGRFFVARYSSSKSSFELQRAVKLAVEAGGLASGSTKIEAHYKRLIQRAELSVSAAGGPFEAQTALFDLTTDNWKKYFEVKDIPLNTLIPIAYEIQGWDGRLAAIKNNIKYYKRTCPTAPVKVEAQVENRLGWTSITVRHSDGTVKSVGVSGDGTSKSVDLTELLSGLDDTVTIRSNISKYGIFGTSKRDTRVKFYADNEDTGEGVNGSCKTCHSADLATFKINKTNGMVKRL